MVAHTSARRRSLGVAGALLLFALGAVWTPSSNAEDPKLAEAVGDAYDAFVERLDSTNPLEDELPFYEAKLPYYQRLFAAALSRSIRASLTYGDQLGTESRAWLEQLPRDASRLLLSGESPDDDQAR